ncbi:MAG: mechanosensitive ion channel family protein [Deltaproteobacteria bacterium]|nr:mechanosensitive ion channel family protein [Deltaproteobacteria bacterium]
MQNFDVTVVVQNGLTLLTAVGLKIIGAVVLWIIGRWLIRTATSLIDKALERQSVDTTVARYIASSIAVLLTIALVIALLGFFGVETTTFAALLAAGGVAIGVAWSGMLANFAAGVFMVILRPFKVGDFISAGGVTGTVTALDLFATTINTPDNVKTIVGNNKIFADNIQNFSANAYRRVDLTAQLAHGVDALAAMALLKPRLAAIANVLPTPAPDVEILEFTAAGPVLAVRPYCNNANYWQVYFDANKTIRDTFGAAGYAVPAQQYVVRQS